MTPIDKAIAALESCGTYSTGITYHDPAKVKEALTSLKALKESAGDVEPQLDFIEDVLRYYKQHEEMDTAAMPRVQEALISLDRVRGLLQTQGDACAHEFEDRGCAMTLTTWICKHCGMQRDNP